MTFIQPVLSPFLKQPTCEGSRFLVFSDEVQLSGQSQPGAIVKIFKDGIFLGETNSLTRSRSDEVLQLSIEPLEITGDSQGNWAAVSYLNSPVILLKNLRTTEEDQKSLQ